MKSPSVGASGLRGAADNVRSHRGRLDIDLAGVDDLVLVGGRAFDGFPLGLLDLAQLELDLLAEDRADLDRLGLRFVADAARLHLVEAGLDAVLGRLEFALLVHRRGARRLIDRGGRIDHVDPGPLRALVGHGLLAGGDELHRAGNRPGTAGHQHQDDWEKQRSCGHIFLQLIVSEFHGTRYEWAGLQPVLVLAIRCSLRFQIVDPGSARPAQGMPSAAYPFGGANVHRTFAITHLTRGLVLGGADARRSVSAKSPPSPSRATGVWSGDYSRDSGNSKGTGGGESRASSGGRPPFTPTPLCRGPGTSRRTEPGPQRAGARPESGHGPEKPRRPARWLYRSQCDRRI